MLELADPTPARQPICTLAHRVGMATPQPPTRPNGFPQQLGVPGLSLSGPGTWATSAEAREQGRRGEERTAAVLAHLLTPGGPSVLHSLRLPMAGVEADIDHVVVAGRDVWILDSKTWRPAFYWTLRGRTRRGWRPVSFADRHTSEMALQSLRRRFVESEVSAVVHRPLVVVWPSNQASQMNLALYRPRGAKAIHGDALEGRLARMSQSGPADPAVVAVLYPLLSTARLAATRERPHRVLDEF